MVLSTLNLVASLLLLRQQLNKCSAHLSTLSSQPLSLKQLILQQNMNSLVLEQLFSGTPKYSGCIHIQLK